jgi:hypothetical protein
MLCLQVRRSKGGVGWLKRHAPVLSHEHDIRNGTCTEPVKFSISAISLVANFAVKVTKLAA